MQTLAMQPIGTHPFAKVTTQYDSMGNLWIHFACVKCGDRLQKRCSNPQRVQQHAFRYATLHGHGLRPVR